MKTSKPGTTYSFAGLLLAILLLATASASAKLLDNFNDNTKTAWADTAAGGSVTEAGSVFTIVSSAVAGNLASSKKTSDSFTNASGHTIEIRAYVNSVSPDGNGHAVIGWVPSGALNSSGYSVSVSTTNVTIYKAGSSLYASNLVTSIQSTNLLVVMRMSGAGSAVSVRASVYKKGNGNNLLLFEQTVNDATGILGAGNAALGALNSPSGPAVTAVFDDLSGFDIINNDFTANFSAARTPQVNLGSGNRLTADNWVDFHSSESLVPVTPVENTSTPGELSVTTFNTAATYLIGSFYNGKTFKIADGSRLEFQIDLTGPGSDNPVILPLLSYLPAASGLSTLSTYFLGDALAAVVAGKSASTFWYYNVGGSTVKSGNVRLIQHMSGEGTAVRIEQRIEDLDVADVNDPARVIFQTTTVDTTATYINFNGSFCVLVYHDNTAGAGNTVRFDNAVVNQTAPGNTSPTIGNPVPANGSTFNNTNRAIFTVADDVNIPLANIVLTLNGVRYTNGHPSVTISPNGATATLRTFTLSNLVVNTYYNGEISATDNQGATSTAHYEFDTFSTSNLTIEAEDYNFSTNGTSGAAFIDNPVLVGEPGTDPNSYNGATGLEGIDFHDNRGGFPSYGDPDHSYRSDPPRQYHTGDGPRAKYVTAGGEALGFYETTIGADNANGDWLNYSRTFAPGTYTAYLRVGTYNMPYSLHSLEKVTSDPTVAGQTTRQLGSFLQLGGAAGDSGYDVYRLVPLTDASGNRVVLRMSGINTVRLRNVYTDFHSDVFLNYMVFVPTADPGVLPPVVASASPTPGTATRVDPMPSTFSASIVRRDTTVNLGTVALQINGVSIPSAAVVSDGDGGAVVSWSITNVPPTRTVTNSVTFNDSNGTPVAYSWTSSYPFLSSTNRLPVGALSSRGFAHRTVQDDLADGDSLFRAEQQLAIPPEIPVSFSYSTNVQTLDWNDAGPNYVPGLDPGGFNYIATEDLAYLQLTAGLHRFNVSSDDGFQLRSGASPSDPLATVLCQADGDTFGGSFDFMVEADGLYPVRNVWYEQAGGANFTLRTFNPVTSANLVVNDPADPAGGVKAFLAGNPVLLLASSNVTGPYSTVLGAVINQATKTITVPASGAPQFYRIQGPSAVTIQSITIVGGNVVIKYL